VTIRQVLHENRTKTQLVAIHTQCYVKAHIRVHSMAPSLKALTKRGLVDEAY